MRKLAKSLLKYWVIWTLTKYTQSSTENSKVIKLISSKIILTINFQYLIVNFEIVLLVSAIKTSLAEFLTTISLTLSSILTLSNVLLII